MCGSWSTGYTGRVLKCGKEIKLTGIPFLQPPARRGRRWGGGDDRRREQGSKRGKGRKREDILQGTTVIYEQATSNKQGEGDTPSPIKPGEAEEGEERNQSKRQRFKERGTVEKRKVGGKLVCKGS